MAPRSATLHYSLQPSNGLLASILQSTVNFAAQHAANAMAEENVYAASSHDDSTASDDQAAQLENTEGVTVPDTSGTQRRIDKMTNDDFAQVITHSTFHHLQNQLLIAL